MPATLEGKVVRVSDRIAYINHDIDDALRAGVLDIRDIPYTDVLGQTHSKRINALITDLVNSSMGKNELIMSPDIQRAFDGLHTFMFESVYTNPVAKSEESKAKHLIKQLYEYFMDEDRQFDEYTISLDEGRETAVCDYIAGMTDRYAIQRYTEIFVPQAWNR